MHKKTSFMLEAAAVALLKLYVKIKQVLRLCPTFIIQPVLALCQERINM